MGHTQTRVSNKDTGNFADGNAWRTAADAFFDQVAVEIGAKDGEKPKFTPIFNGVLEAEIQDKGIPLAVRFRSWVYRKSWGNLSGHCVNGIGGKDLHQRDAAKDLGSSTTQISRLMDHWRELGYFKSDTGHRIFPETDGRKIPGVRNFSRQVVDSTFNAWWDIEHPEATVQYAKAQAEFLKWRNLKRQAQKKYASLKNSDTTEFSGKGNTDTTESAPETPRNSESLHPETPIFISLNTKQGATDPPSDDRPCSGQPTPDPPPVVRPVEDPVKEEINEFLTREYALPVAPDEKVLTQLAEMAKDHDGVEQFKEACRNTRDAKPRGWMYFVPIMKRCAEHREEWMRARSTGPPGTTKSALDRKAEDYERRKRLTDAQEDS